MFKTLSIIVIIATLGIFGSLWFFSKDSDSVDPSLTKAGSLEVSKDISQNQSASSTNTTETAINSTSTKINETINNKKYMNATLHTNKGDITIKFLENGVPQTVANFTKLVSENFYDGVKFHRVIKGFMIQGGDPLTKDDSKKSIWGTGGPGYKFADELTPENHNDIGTISMANAGPNTNGSQFFVNTAANNFLDKKHVVFGTVISGMDVVKEIENSKTDSSDRPLDPVIIKSITLK